jgi:hypothetical protein
MSEDTGAQRATDQGTQDADRNDTPPGAVEEVLHDTGDENVPAAERDATAASTVERRTRGWGSNEDAPPLSDQQVAGLQEHEEPVAAADFGGAFPGDLGNAEVADEAADAPETVEPDTSLGHDGGRRYEDYSGGAGGSA